MAEYRALRERLLAARDLPHAGPRHRSHAAAGPPDRCRRGDPLLRPAAAARADGPALRLHQGRRAADRAADRRSPPTSIALRVFEPREALAHVLDGDPPDPARARRPRAAHRLCRRAVHAGVVRDRRRALEQLRQDQGADVRPSRRLASPLRQVRDRRRRLPRRADRRGRRRGAGVRLVGRRAQRRRLPRVRAAAHAADLRRRSAARVPTIHFGTGTATILEELREAGGDVIGVDWRIPIDEAWDAHRRRPRASRATSIRRCCSARRRGCSSRPTTSSRASAAGPGHIFNLGHGILPSTPVEHVQMLAQYVHSAHRDGH